MMDPTLRLEIVSAEKQIFSGEATAVFATGAMGELGITPGHAPLLTTLKPGNIIATLPNGDEEVFYISGGMLEVQPFIVSVLANTAERADALDEAAAMLAKETAEKKLSAQPSDVDYARAAGELAEAIAQIRAIQNLRKRTK